MPAVSGVFTLLNGTFAITSLLNTYRATTGSAKVPAIFSSFQVPDDATGPLILIQNPGSSKGGRSEDRGHIAGISLVNVIVYDEKSRSSKVLRNIAIKVWETLHRGELNDETYDMWVLATPPQQLPDPEGFPGYLISCEVRLRQKGD